ncbi:L-rhamnose mutarotase [Flagellimonas sp.]|uniref:L-rhamnose mutarotase n=1 Tax=Flagellimonas sp. TaxID=2058762 RepID=UPI003BAA3CE0
MIRKVFKMQLHEEAVEEYRKRHNPIWPELETLLKDKGVHNYSIFLDDESYSLFAYAEIESEIKWREISKSTVCLKWWAHMSSLMETNTDNSPVSKDLIEMFHID